MKKPLRGIIAIASLVALISLALARCKVGMNEEILNAVDPSGAVAGRDLYSGSAAVYDASQNVVSLSEAYDIGYADSGAISRTFSIRNTGTRPLVLYTITSSNDAAISVSSKPAGNTTLAASEAASFTLTQANPASAAQATITVTTSDSNGTDIKLAVYGGGKTSNLTVDNSFDYRLTGKGYDFGYVSGERTSAITLTNSGTTAIQSLAADCPASDFTVQSITPGPIAPGAKASLVVKYAPPSTTALSEATCTLSDASGRKFLLALTGTGFQQPADLGVVPALWFRADRMRLADAVKDGDTYYVNSWADVGKNALSAVAINSLRPAYNNAGINGQPSLTFSNNKPKAHLQVNSSVDFIDSAPGTTTFVVFKTDASAISTSEYILSFGSNDSFPTLSFDIMYYDPVDGFYQNGAAVGNPLTRLRWRLYGSSGQARYPKSSGVDYLPLMPLSAKVYSSVMVYNAASAIAPPSTTPNIFMNLNDEAMDLRFYYSNSNNNATGQGAYGKPVGDGVGNINSAISTTDPSWSNEYAKTLYDSLLSHKHSYFYNQIEASAASVNRNIRLLNIGATSSSTGLFCGEIAEIIMFDSVLDNTQKAVITTYLKNKYRYDL